ncbi:MAG TPA: hypothetical protein VMJ10_03820 [Kofleriaceae bacterium]|nr:hypothetical protein [Kofleriaceae bacterium]
MMRLWIWTGLAAVLGLVLGMVPLFDVLGYELALATAAFATIAGLDLGAAYARERQLTATGPIALRARHAGRALAGSTLVAAGRAIAVAAIPGAIAAVRGIWRPTCDWWFGLEAYALMPLASAALAGALGHAIGIAAGTRARRSWRPHRATVLAQLAWVVLALGALWRFYAEPPVFTYSPVIGFFPGNLYDEDLQLGAPLLWSRLEAVLWVVAILAVVASRLDVPTFRLRWREPRPATRRIGALVLAAAALAGAIGLRLHAGTLGYAVDADDIEDALGGELETPHFIIDYARTPEIEADLPLIAADHELRYAEVVAQLGDAPEGKLRSFYFANADQKARWIGARNVEMAKPWLHAILIDHRPFPHASLRHEIAHAVASAFGDPIFGVAIRDGIFANPGLIEGLAVAIDWPGSDNPLTPHQAVRAMQQLGVEPSIRELMSLQFLSVSSARGYTTAGSFVRFLLDRYGAARLRALYRSGDDYDAAYGKSMAELEAEWKQMIAAIELPAGVVEATRERFRGGGVFSRPCPHAIAARRERAAEAYVRGERGKAIALLRTVCGDAPDEPRFQLELGDYLVSGDDAERAEANALWTAIANDEHATSSLRADALDRLARTSAVHGDMPATMAYVARAAALPLDGSARRLRDAEQLALHHDGPAGTALRGYFFAAGTSRDAPMWAQLAVLAEPDLGIAHYLLGFQRHGAGEWRGAATELQLALDRGLPSTGFVAQAARMLAVSAYRVHDLDGVRHAIAALRGPGMSDVDHLLADDWERRLTFDATGHL